MAFEQETQTIMNIIVIGMILIGVSTIVFLYFKNKIKSLFWFIGNFVFSLIAYYFMSILLFIDRDIPQPMISEENSMLISFGLLFWVLSMVFLIVGIWRNNILKESNR